MRDGWILLVILLALSRRKSSSIWSDDEMRTFIDQIRPVGIPLDAVLAVWTSESGLDPHQSSGVAWGLNQAQGPLLRAAGFTGAPATFATLDVRGQLPFLAKMLRLQVNAIGYTPETDLELYVANFSPTAAKARAFKIYDSQDPKQRAAYLSNRALDRDHKGFISTNDLALSLDTARRSTPFKTALAQLAKLLP